MLTPELVNRIRETLAAQLTPRDRMLADELMRDQRRAAPTVGAVSGAVVAGFIERGCDELFVRGGLAWAAIRRSPASLAGTYVDGILDDLRLQIAEHLDAQSLKVIEICTAAIGPAFRTQQGTLQQMVRQQIRERGREVAAKLDVEAQFYVDELKRIATTPVGATAQVMNFIGPVGVVQTAPFATANVSLTGPEGGRLVAALEELLQAIQRSTEATAEQRTEAADIVADVIVAAKADKPNSSKVAGLLGGLATGVQTIGSLRPAYEMVKAAAAAVGIPLP